MPLSPGSEPPQNEHLSRRDHHIDDPSSQTQVVRDISGDSPSDGLANRVKSRPRHRASERDVARRVVFARRPSESQGRYEATGDDMADHPHGVEQGPALTPP